MQARGLEGLIAKKKDSCYEPGGRTSSWVKFKWALEQEFVIGGFTPPQGTRSFFGALIIGYFENGQLRFAGKVGTGFDYQALQDLHGRLSRLEIGSPPFLDIRAKRGREGYGLTAVQIRDSTWVRPELVCQVRFTEWTHEGQLRHPTYLGLREDKAPAEVVREPVAGG
jgi:bifunctional non-homologous end joining protein LigD